MLSDEENKMLEIFKKEVEKEQNEYEQVNEYTKFYYNNHKFILNLIEKQSKEIEELKKYKEGYKLLSLVEEQQHKIEKLINANDNLKKTKRIKNMEYVNQNYVSKDKIKAKIEELENQKRQWIEDRDNKHKDSEIIYAIEVLQSLLEKE